jgi:hypothetical protein
MRVTARTLVVAMKRTSSAAATGAMNPSPENMATNMVMGYPLNLGLPEYPQSKKACTGLTPWEAGAHIMMILTIIVRIRVDAQNVTIMMTHVCSLFYFYFFIVYFCPERRRST